MATTKKNTKPAKKETILETVKKKTTGRFWKFEKKDEAVKKLNFLKNPDTYEIVHNRENGKIAKGWILRKRK